METLYTLKEVAEHGIDDTDWYMIDDHIWRKFVPEDKKMVSRNPGEKGYFLCLECLQKRVGRRLTKDDFTQREISDYVRRWLERN